MEPRRSSDGKHRDRIREKKMSEVLRKGFFRNKLFRKILFSNPYLRFAARFIVAFVFILAAAEKISDPGAFAESIANYRILPEFSHNIAAILLPWLELFCGVLLLCGISVRENTVILALLLAVFILMIASAMIRGLDINCGCFGSHLDEKAGYRKIAENLLLLLLCLYSYLAYEDDSEAFNISKISQNRLQV